MQIFAPSSANRSARACDCVLGQQLWSPPFALISTLEPTVARHLPFMFGSWAIRLRLPLIVSTQGRLPGAASLLICRLGLLSYLIVRRAMKSSGLRDSHGGP